MRKFCSSCTFRELQKQVCQRKSSLLAESPATLADTVLQRINQVTKKYGRGDMVGIGVDFLELFEHLCVFAEKMGIDLHRAMIWKYPGVCPYCVRKVCECRNLLVRPTKAPDKVLEPFRRKALLWKVEKWVQRDWLMYPCDIFQDRLEKLWRHFLSEGIELAQEMLRSGNSPSEGLVSETGDLGEKIINLCGLLHVPLISMWNVRYQIPKRDSRNVPAAT